MSIFRYTGNARQNEIARVALEERCEFYWPKLLPGLAREGKTTIEIAWADLSRYTATTEKAGGGHDHIHDEGGGIAHPIEREVEGRMAVLGLYYLPPHTKVVIHSGLESNPELAGEVANAEATAHAVDYCYMTLDMRRAFVNSIHSEPLPAHIEPRDGIAFRLDGHDCSYFDVGPYSRWCGEAFMEAAIEALTDYRCTLQLFHEVGDRSREVVRGFLLDPPAPEESPEPEAPPTVEPTADRVYRSKPNSKVAHDSHRGLDPVEWFDSLAVAQAAGLRACKTCRPT